MIKNLRGTGIIRIERKWQCPECGEWFSDDDTLHSVLCMG